MNKDFHNAEESIMIDMLNRFDTDVTGGRTDGRTDRQTEFMY